MYDDNNHLHHLCYLDFPYSQIWVDDVVHPISNHGRWAMTLSTTPDAMFNRAQKENAAHHQPDKPVRPRQMKALGVAQRLAGMKARFDKRLDAVLEKADAAEKRGEAGIQTMENYTANFDQEIKEMEEVINTFTNGAPFETPPSGS